MLHRSLSLVLALVVTAAPCLAVESSAPLAPTAKPTVVDVALRADGVLLGQLVTPGGAPLAKTKVSLLTTDGREAVAETTAEGAFAFKGVKGVVTVRSEQNAAVVRGWAPGTAPPSATKALLMVRGEGLARGQQYAGPRAQGLVSRSKQFFANPLFVAGVVGTAVAVPVAIANDDDDPAS